MGGRESADDLSKNAGGDRRKQRDRDDSTPKAGDLPSLADDGFAVNHDTLQGGEYLPARIREGDATLVAIE